MTFEFSCEHCQKQYALPYERVKGRVLKVRCKQCQNLMVVRDPQRAQVSTPSLAEPQTMGAQTLFSLQAIPSREEEEARLNAHHQSDAPQPPALPPLPLRSQEALSPAEEPQVDEPQVDEPQVDEPQVDEPTEGPVEGLETPSLTPQISRTYRSESSVKVEVPKPTEEWAQEVAADLDRPITREIKIDQLQGVRSGVDFRPAHVRYMPYILGVALAGGLAALILPNLGETPNPVKPRASKPVKEVVVTLNEEAISSAKRQVNVALSSDTMSPTLSPSSVKQGEASVTTTATTERATSVTQGASSGSPQAEPAPSEAKALSAAAPPPATKTSKSGGGAVKSSKRPAQSKRSRGAASRKPGLPQSSVRQIVQQNVGSLSYCYQKIQKKTSLGPVKTRLSFTVLPNGRTKPGARLSGKHKNTKLERCIALAVQRWRFPSAEGESEVRYPLNFTPGF